MKKIFQLSLLMLSLLVIAHTLFPGQVLALASAVPHGVDVYHALFASAVGTSLASGLCLPIGDIVLEDCGANPGGLTDLHVIRRRNILTFPEPDDADGLTISTSIVPKAGEGFSKWDFATDTGDLNHKSGGDAGNQSITHEINTYVPRGVVTIDAIINAAINGDFVVIGTDSLGNRRILGDKRRGVKFDYDYKSGKKGNDKNGTDFKFSGEGFAHLPYYYTAAIPLKGAVAGDA
jgi:hypothetical protein